MTTTDPACLAANAAYAAGDEAAMAAHARTCEACALLVTLVPLIEPSPVTDGMRAFAAELERAIATRERILSRYRIDGVIARGGQGIVCRAEDDELGTLAIKVVRCHPGARDGRLPEGRIASKLTGKGVCRIFTIERHGDIRLVVMELVEGECLEDALPRLAPAQRLAIFRRVCEAVADIHRAGVLHLDLKPRNIVLRAGDEPVVTDFGVAVPLGLDGRALPLGHTRKYAPPEQLAGEPVDRRADVYALGVTLRDLVPDASTHVRRVIARATSDDPARRHAGAAELLADLDRPARRRRLIVRMAVPVAVLAVAGGGVFALTRSHAAPAPDVVLDFDELEVLGYPGRLAPAPPVLARAGITVESISPGTRLVIADSISINEGKGFVAPSAPNVLAHVGSNKPVQFTLQLPRPVARVAFRRPALVRASDSGITFPQWTAIALDECGGEVARVGEPLLRDPHQVRHVDARDFVLAGRCISAIRFESVNGFVTDGQYHEFAAFNAVLLDDLALTYGDC